MNQIKEVFEKKSIKQTQLAERSAKVLVELMPMFVTAVKPA